METFKINENDTGQEVADKLTEMFNYLKPEIYTAESNDGQILIDAGFSLFSTSIVAIDGMILSPVDYSISNTEVSLFNALWQGQRILIKK